MGVDARSAEWIEVVEKAMLVPALRQTAEQMTEAVKRRVEPLEEQKNHLQTHVRKLRAAIQETDRRSPQHGQ